MVNYRSKEIIIIFHSDPREDLVEVETGRRQATSRRPHQKSLQVLTDDPHAQGVHLGLLPVLSQVATRQGIPGHGPEEEDKVRVPKGPVGGRRTR